MREILFRGKRIDNGEWVYGFYFCMHHDDDREHLHHFIIPLNVPLPKDKPIGEIQVEVDPTTVGQCTGLTDKNGKKIFEGDIVHYIYDSGKENGWKVDQNSIIKWDFSGFYMDGIFGSNKYVCRSGWLENIACNGGKFFEVIGNIHDNPELLEVN